jgi:glutamyl-tRNA synthetase
LKDIRVRFAPSPTGSLHIGGVRTALYNYLFAKKLGGKFIIRIEDTDKNRYVEKSEAYIYEALRWLGLEADESVEKGGPFAPYKQSERLEIYQKHAWDLVERGWAYLAFDTGEDLEMAREKSKEGGVSTFQYNAATRMLMKNSLSLPGSEVEQLKEKHPFVIRLKVPKKEEIRLHDLIRGWVMVHSSTMDDKVLLKSDGMPTYHLANVVDDYLMKISHVIRGEEWLPSAPTHVLLYKAFGWENEMPLFAHLPLLLKPSGDGKLSKRDGMIHGFPVFPLSWTDAETGNVVAGFREEGYLPEAMINFLAFQGWNPGTEQEIFSLSGLIETFSLERIGKSGTRFDIQKAKWFNHHYLQEKPDYFFAAAIQSVLEPNGLWHDGKKLAIWVRLVKSRASFVHEMLSEIEQIAQWPVSPDAEFVRSKWNEETKRGLSAFADWVGKSQDLTAEEAKAAFQACMEELGIKPGKVLPVLRMAVTGKPAGPDLMTIVELLGGHLASRRMADSMQWFSEISGI